MKTLTRVGYVAVILMISLVGCNRSTSKNEIYNKDFKWTITIPQDFENVSAREWLKMQNKGVEAIEQSSNLEVINQAKIIFVFKSDELNYFEANQQPYNVETDGDYLESCQTVNSILYETFLNQMPGIKVDTIQTIEKIDGLTFQKFAIKVVYPNQKVFYSLMYSRLFLNRELAVNIMYVDEEKGQKMIESWKSSKFGK